MAILGIDVSFYQDNVNWQAVAADGVVFAFAKATEGINIVDDKFASFWAGMRAAGIIRGAYHFFRPAASVQAQVNLFVNTIKKLEVDDLPPVLDVEVTNGMNIDTIVNGMQQWLSAVEKALGRRPIIYTSPNFWESQLGDLQQFSNYPLWIAHYGTDNPIIPGAWSTWTFHQYSESGNIKGIAGNVDLNRFESFKQGNTGSYIKELQTVLQTKGFYTGNIDGNFTAAMTSAVKSFQKAMELDADGIIGLKTWLAITGPAKPITSAQVKDVSKPPTTPAKSTISLINVCKYYNALPNQNQALQWLQGQIPQNTLNEFARRWRNQTTVQASTIRLVDVCKYYNALPYQDQALVWLQGQISNTVLDDFAQRWRS